MLLYNAEIRNSGITTATIDIKTSKQIAGISAHERLISTTKQLLDLLTTF